MIKSITLIRVKNSRKHITHLKMDVPMHLDIIEKLVNRCLRLRVRPHLIESIWENGYNREDQEIISC